MTAQFGVGGRLEVYKIAKMYIKYVVYSPFLALSV
jgi:hypothetical protein